MDVTICNPNASIHFSVTLAEITNHDPAVVVSIDDAPRCISVQALRTLIAMLEGFLAARQQWLAERNASQLSRLSQRPADGGDVVD